MHLLPVIQEYQLREFLESKKKRQDHDLTGGSKGSHREPLVPSKGLQPLTLTSFQSGTTIPTDRALSIGTI